MTTPAVDPCAGRQAEQEKRRRLGRDEQANLELGGVQRHDGDQRQRQVADVGADLGDRVSHEELPEVEAAQQTGPGHIAMLSRYSS
jgi:hypothetical protein